jgi:hypothetical protein
MFSYLVKINCIYEGWTHILVGIISDGICVHEDYCDTGSALEIAESLRQHQLLAIGLVGTAMNMFSSNIG